MATDSFKFWDSYYEALKTLETKDQRSDFIMSLCEYVFDGVDPTFDDKMVEFGFMLVRKQAELSKEIASTARENGKRGGRPAKKPTSKPTPKPRSKPTSKPTPKPRSKPTSKPTSKANRSEEKRSDYSSMSRYRDSGACAPGACAPAHAPFDDTDLEPPPPPPPEP